MSAVQLVQGILAVFVTMKEHLRVMQKNEESLSALVREVLVYEGLIQEKQKSLSIHPISSSDPHHAAICNFHLGMKGLESILKDYTSGKGFFQRAYNFCHDWCCAPENEKKIREHSEKISKAAIILGYSAVTQLEQKADFLIIQGKQLQSSLDAAIEKLKAGNSNEFALEVSALLKMELSDVKADLQKHEKDLVEKFGAHFAQMHQRFDRLEDLLRGMEIDAGGNVSQTILSDDAREFWNKYFNESKKVTTGEMSKVLETA